MDENKEEEKSFLDDPNFSLTFVNKKSSERVLELVDEIKTAFSRPELKIENKAPECLAKADNNLELLLHTSNILKYEQDPDPPQMNPPRLASLKPFLFPFYPASVPKTSQKPILDSDFNESRRNFLVDSRLDHERLLWSFQDRFVRDLCTGDDQSMQAPFQIATVQLAKEQTLPIHLVEKKKVTLQTRYNALMKKSQKKTATVLEIEKRNAKMVQDIKQFQINFSRMQKNELPSATIDKQYEIPVSCPFSFLCDTNNTK